MAKRPNGEGTIFQDHKANRWRAQFKDNDGNRRNLSSKTQNGIHKKLRDAISAREAGKLTKAPSEIESLGEYLDSWYEIQSKSIWEFKTSENNALEIKRYIKPVLGEVRLDLLTPEMILRAYVIIKETHILSESSMHRIHRLLKSALKRAVKLRKIVVNPMDGVDAPKIRKAKLHVLEEKEILCLLESAKLSNLEWNALWRLVLLTGLRQGEVLGLSWNNVDLGTNSIQIVQQLQRQTGKGLVLKRLKTDIDGRRIYLDSETVSALKKWRSEQVALKLRRGFWGEDDLVFTNTVGNPIEPRQMARKWASLLKINNLEHIKLHGARHSFATWMIKNGTDIKIVSHYLGHSDIKTTVNIYNHVTDSNLESTAEKIEYLTSRNA